MDLLIFIWQIVKSSYKLQMLFFCIYCIKNNPKIFGGTQEYSLQEYFWPSIIHSAIYIQFADKELRNH